MRELVARGHSIGLHAYRHERLYAMKSEEAVKSDLAQGLRTIEEITGVRPTWFRPPIGHSHPGIARAAESLDLTVIGWSVSARDGLKWTHPADVLGRVRRGAKDGAVILMHDAAEHGDVRAGGGQGAAERARDARRDAAARGAARAVGDLKTA